MTGLSPTAVIDKVPTDWKPFTIFVFVRHACPSRSAVTSVEVPGAYANTLPERDTVTTPSPTSLATALSRVNDIVAGSPASPTHRSPSFGSRTASTEPPCTCTAPSGRVTA